jgi:hypothetical protein
LFGPGGEKKRTFNLEAIHNFGQQAHFCLMTAIDAYRVPKNGVFMGNHHYKVAEEFNLLESSSTAFHDEPR